MKKERYPFTVLFWVTAIVLAIGFGCCLTSCAASKAKQSSHVITDSLSHVQEKKDTTSRHDSSHLQKEHTTVRQHADTSHTREETTIHQVKEVTKYDTSGKVKEYHKTTTDLTKKKDQSAGGKSSIEDHSKIDSSAYKNHDSGSHAKQGTTQLHKEESQKQKQTRSRSWLWWLLLIPLGYLIWKNRSIIWGLMSWALERIKRIVVSYLQGCNL